ncbi:MAG: hypothetical protein AAF926_08830, partial [Pseudomonadota bacterium]
LDGLTFDEIMAAATQVGADVLFEFAQGLRLTLSNVDLDDLTQDDFGFAATTQKAVETGPLIAEVDNGLHTTDAATIPRDALDIHSPDEWIDYGLM